MSSVGTAGTGVVLGLLAVFGPAGTPGASQAATRDYRFLVGKYCESGLEAVIGELLPARVRPSGALDTKTRAAAAAMHTEVLAALWQGETSLHPPGPHFRFARDLVHGIGDDADHLASGWTLAMGYLLIAHLAFSLADDLFLEARQRFPRDAHILVAAGSLQEVYTQPIGRQFLGLQRGTGDNWRGEGRLKAVALYRQALAVEAKHAEAHLRLGRVSQVAGDSREARQQLEWVLTHGSHPWLTYLAHLFLGELSEQEGRKAVAERHYERATAAWPGAQTAALALAALRVRSGAGPDALRSLGPRFDGSRGLAHRDPWLDYQFANTDRFHAALEAVRRRACQ